VGLKVPGEYIWDESQPPLLTLPALSVDKRIGLKNTPTVTASAAVKVSTDTTDTSNCNNGLAWSIGVRDDFDLDVLGTNVNLFSFKKDNLFGDCIQWVADVSPWSWRVSFTSTTGTTGTTGTNGTTIGATGEGTGTTGGTTGETGTTGGTTGETGGETTGTAVGTTGETGGETTGTTGGTTGTTGGETTGTTGGETTGTTGGATGGETTGTGGSGTNESGTDESGTNESGSGSGSSRRGLYHHLAYIRGDNSTINGTIIDTNNSTITNTTITNGTVIDTNNSTITNDGNSTSAEDAMGDYIDSATNSTGFDDDFNAAMSSAYNSTDSDADAEAAGFTMVSLFDFSGAYVLASNDNGNLYLAEASEASDFTWATEDDVVLGDGDEASFFYYPDEMWVAPKKPKAVRPKPLLTSI
jgi:hypothetical protein